MGSILKGRANFVNICRVVTQRHSCLIGIASRDPSCFGWVLVDFICVINCSKQLRRTWLSSESASAALAIQTPLVSLIPFKNIPPAQGFMLPFHELWANCDSLQALSWFCSVCLTLSSTVTIIMTELHLPERTWYWLASPNEIETEQYLLKISFLELLNNTLGYERIW